jgi:hypothetical protein
VKEDQLMTAGSSTSLRSLSDKLARQNIQIA